MINKYSYIDDWLKRGRRAEAEAHAVLIKYAADGSRVVQLSDLLKKLDKLPIDVKDYFSEAVGCLEHGYHRASIVMSWTGFYQVFSETLVLKHIDDIKGIRKKWAFKDVTELNETVSESQVIDVAKEVTFINKSLVRILQGHLSTRNQCAHPTLYRPRMNTCIGYVDEMITRTIKYI